MSDQKSPDRRAQIVVLLALAIATILKIEWIVSSIGSADTFIFFTFGKVLSVNPLKALYEAGPLFNHTPLAGLFVKHLYLATHGKIDPFSKLLRAPSVLADIGLVLALLHVRRVTGRPPWWALTLFAISPVSIMVSGFHGNLDPVMVLLVFCASIAVMHGRPALCGILFAAACNVKMMPLLFTPLFFFFWWARSWRTAARFTVPFAILMLVGSAVPLVQCPGAYLQHVFGYGGFWGGWGITFWLRQTGMANFQPVNFSELTHVESLIMTTLKCVVIASTLAIAWRRRKVPPSEFFGTVGAVWVVLFVFAPGAAVQYMVWYAPFILLLEPRWWAAITTGASVYMFLFYHSASKWEFPWTFAFPTDEQVPFWSPWSNLPWAAFIGLLIFEGRKWWTAVVPAGEQVGLVPQQQPLPASAD